MRLLLDTHCYLWAIMDHPNLSPAAKRLMTQAEQVFVSSASIWELSIKIALGKLTANINQLVAEITASGFNALAITPEHAAAVRQLPPLHRDPFDRLLIAQAQCEPLRLLTADQQLEQYSPLVITL